MLLDNDRRDRLVYLAPTVGPDPNMVTDHGNDNGDSADWPLQNSEPVERAQRDRSCECAVGNEIDNAD